MQFIQLLGNSWILAVLIIVLGLLLVLLSGRWAPKMVVIVMIVVAGICYLGWEMDLKAGSPIKKEEKMSLDSISRIASGGEKEMWVGSDSSENAEANPSLLEDESVIYYPSSYDLQPRGRITVKGTDNIVLIKEIKRSVSMQRWTEGDLVVEVDQDGGLSPSNDGTIKGYKYTGGYLEISINGKKCCCGNRVKLAPENRQADLERMHQYIDQEIHRKYVKNRSLIFDAFKDCLKGMADEQSGSQFLKLTQ